ncbi:MAG: rhodanese-like domain-containing protein [Clostridia bacterium]|nr:rhodanese-like domain-containing protein [Clostridia bacterium]
MRKNAFLVAILAVLTAFCASCAPFGDGGKTGNDTATGTPFTSMPSATGSQASTPEPAPKGSYTQITQEEAKEMMARDDGHIILDVRRFDEFDEGHIPGAVCVPNESIGGAMPKELPDLEQIILVYCRSGRRSKEASQKLADLGYVNVYEFGGIIDWTGEVVRD